MLYYTLPQAGEFAAMLLAGVLLGGIMLLFSWLRRLMRAGFFISLACDLLMGLLWAGVVCLALTIACRGRARAFHFAGMALGGALFLAAASPLTRAAGRTAARWGRRAAHALGKNRFVRALLR
jgi:hypothetical protein